MLEESRSIVRLHIPRMDVYERCGRRDHYGQRNQRGDDGVGPAEESGKADRNRNYCAESQNDRAQCARGAIDDQHQRHQKNSKQGHEALGGRACLPLEPSIEPRRSDASYGCERTPRGLEGQNEGIDRRQCPVALAW